jgi:hypothetical protein
MRLLELFSFSSCNDHAWVFEIDLIAIGAWKKLPCPARGFLFDTLNIFFKFEKRIIARIDDQGDDDVDNKTSDEMTEKWEMEWDEQPLILEHPDSFPKLKSLWDLSISIEAKVAEEDVDNVGLWVNGGAQLRLNVRILLQRVLDPSDPLHRSLFLVCHITDIPLERVIPVGVVCRGGGPCFVTELGRTVRVVEATALLVL